MSSTPGTELDLALREPQTATAHAAIDAPSPGESLAERGDGTSRPVAKLVPGGTKSGWPMRLAYLCSDLLGIALGISLAILLTNLLGGERLAVTAAVELKAVGCLAVGLLMVASLQGSYQAIPPRPVRQFRGWVLGALTTYAVLVSSLWLFGHTSWTLGLALAVATSTSFLAAAFLRAMCRIRLGQADWWGTRVLLVKTDGLEQGYWKNLLSEPQWGLRPVGYVVEGLSGSTDQSDPACLGDFNDLEAVAEQAGVERAIMAVHSFDQSDLADLIVRPASRIRQWIILPAMSGFPSLWLNACETGHRPAITFHNRLASPLARHSKRALDLLITVSLLAFLVPVVLVIGLTIKLTGRGNIFYGHERVGRNGKRFKAWKFRTMHPHADQLLAEYLARHPELAEEWSATHKLKCDPRVTWMGRILRSTSLDELPQIWNVLRGDMSLVGPRPIVAAEIEKYAEHYQYYRKVLPGITGLWQVSGRNNTTYARRVELDAYYVQNWSIWLDLYILACTVKVVLLGEGAY